MVENMMDDGVELKPAIIEAHVDFIVKPTIEASIEVKIFNQASTEVKPTGVSKLRDNEVNTALFISQMIEGESEMICLVRFINKRQRVGFTISIDKSNIKNPMLKLQCFVAFLTPNNRLDELKAQLNRYFVHLGENQRTSHVFVQVSCVNMTTDKDEDGWKTVYFPKVIHDDGDVDYMLG